MQWDEQKTRRQAGDTYLLALTLEGWLQNGHAKTVSSFGIFFFGGGFLLLFRFPCSVSSGEREGDGCVEAAMSAMRQSQMAHSADVDA